MIIPPGFDPLVSAMKRGFHFFSFFAFFSDFFSLSFFSFFAFFGVSASSEALRFFPPPPPIPFASAYSGPAASSAACIMAMFLRGAVPLS